LGRRVVDDKNFFWHGKMLRRVLRRSKVHVSGQLDGAEWIDVDLI
jgi:hypothetical protein